MANSKKHREFKRRSVDYQYLAGSWRGDPGRQSIMAIYRSTWGYVRVIGFERSGISYYMIKDGIEYEMLDEKSYRTERGLCSMASRLARQVARGDL